MEDIWQQFHRLPRAIRDSVATPKALATVERLEQDHPGLDLASFIMRLMVKEFPFADLGAKLTTEGKLTPPQATEVMTALTAEVFNQVQDYLGLGSPEASPVPTGPTPPPVPTATATRPADVPSSIPAPTPRPPQPPANLPVVTSPSRPKPQTPAPVVTAPRPTVMTPAIPAPPLPQPMSVPTPTGPIAPTQAYSDEDAQEIAQQSAKLRDLNADGGMASLDTIAQHVMEQHQIAYGDELLTRRAVTVFKSRLKDIRDSETTLAILIRDPKIGGLGMDPDMASNVVTTLEQKVKELKSRGATTPASTPDALRPPAVPVVLATKPEPKPPLTKQLPPDEVPAAPAVPPPAPRVPGRQPQIKRLTDIPSIPNQLGSVAPPAMAPVPLIASLPPIGPVPTLPVQPPATAPTPTVVPTPIPVAAAPSITPMMQRGRVMERPGMTDITKPAVAYGPAGEMQSMTLIEFRRLGQGAGEATRRLLDKFEHWKGESYKIWSEAVAGWRKSEIHTLYLDMGRQSLETNQPIREIIQIRARQNLPYLSEHEFNIIADFNKQLQP